MRDHRKRKTLEQLAADVGDLTKLPEPPSRDLLLKILGKKARAGDNAAIRLLLEEYRRDGATSDEITSAIDELAKRRAG